MLDYKRIKTDFELTFNQLLKENYLFRILLYEIFVYGSAYLVGGYLRDLIEKRKSRDIDIIIDLNHEKLIEIINASNLDYRINRHNGIKLKLDNIEVDMWSIQNNWAFKNNLVKLNEEDKLNSIAKGCFYNYDSLVINLHSKGLNLKFYDQFLKKNELEILQKSPSYKSLNPTKEANILRAFYLKKVRKVNYSLNTRNYLLTSIVEIQDNFKDPYMELLFTKKKYSKYDNILSDKDIKYYLLNLINNREFGGQLHMKL